MRRILVLLATIALSVIPEHSVGRHHRAGGGDRVTIDRTKGRALKWLRDKKNAIDRKDVGSIRGRRVVYGESDYARLVSALVPHLDPNELLLTKKQLRLELASSLWREDGGGGHLKAGQLALYVQALLAACANPYSFYGENLVRLMYMVPTRSNFEYGLVQLSICQSGKRVGRRIARRLLNNMIRAYQRRLYDTLSMTLRAAKCLLATGNDYNFLRIPIIKLSRKLERKLTAAVSSDDGSINVYTLLEILQALSGKSIDTSAIYVRELAKLQREDGSFEENLSATSAALRIMDGEDREKIGVGRQIFCGQQSQTIDEGDGGMKDVIDVEADPPLRCDSSSNDFILVDYLVWIGTNVSSKYDLTIPVRRNTTFYQIMEIASAYDPNFNFEYTSWPTGHYITSLFGLEENRTTNYYWLLYRIDPDDNRPVIFATGGVDDLIPDDKDEVLFWYKKL